MKKKITIVGAGISGLYLAYLLEDKFAVTIIEARDRVGGRVFSIDGHDMGPSWIWSHHTAILALVNRLGLELFAQYTKGYALYETKDKLELFKQPPSAPSARMQGSLSTLIDALKNALKNTKIILSEELISVQEDTQGVILKTQKSSYKSDIALLTLAPRVALKVSFTPALPQVLSDKMSSTQTWMGHSAKCVVEFKSAFWRADALSGFVFSHCGPLGEIHDASTATQHALFGFVNSNANMKNFEEELKAQLVRVFKIDVSQILAIHLVDWREERFTAVFEDKKALGAHPNYGIDTSAYSDKILFSSTEFSFYEGGYLEGAIRRAQEISEEILK